MIESISLLNLPKKDGQKKKSPDEVRVESMQRQIDALNEKVGAIFTILQELKASIQPGSIEITNPSPSLQQLLTISLGTQVDNILLAHQIANPPATNDQILTSPQKGFTISDFRLLIVAALWRNDFQEAMTHYREAEKLYPNHHKALSEMLRAINQKMDGQANDNIKKGRTQKIITSI